MAPENRPIKIRNEAGSRTNGVNTEPLFEDCGQPCTVLRPL